MERWSTVLLAEASSLLPARYQMAFSLGWHIVIAAFGVAFPAMIFVVHRRGIRGDADALVLAKRWSKVAGVLFALGAVSGTILSFELGLLWPGLMGRFGDVIGLPFALEGIAFFVEAIFLGIYLYGWGRLPPRVHLLTIVPMAISGVFGSFCVIAANAWMNNPSGFRIVDGKVVDVRPLAAMFNPGLWLEWLHMWLAAYMVVGFVVAAVYASGMRKGRRDHLHRLGFLVPFAFASIAAVAQPAVGHVQGLRLNGAQPSKLAALELAPRTERRAPLVIGGVLVDGEVRFGLKLPVLGSIISRSAPNAKIVGLDDLPEGKEVPATVVHLAFQLMVGIAFTLLGGAAWFWWRRRRGGDLLDRPWFLRFALLAGPAAVVALQAGWTVTEVGRQPWIAYRVLRVDQAVTDVGWIWVSLGVIVVVYTSMTVIGVRILRSMSERWRDGGAELRTPYGPEDGH
ncbi:MAG: ythA 2 [Actinomycetia bacterium]|nr:ythA 2 [Actinomycetes bacterium]